MLACLLRLTIRLATLISLACFGVIACYPQIEAFRSDAPLLEESSVLTVKKEVQEVNLILTVTDHRRHFVRNLTQAQITIQDNSQPPEKITYFKSQTNLPLRVALVIDRSNSVFYCFDFEKHAAETFLRHVVRSASDVALVIGFNEQARLAQGPTSNHHLLSRAIKGILAGGETAIYDAVVLASRELGMITDAQPSRRAVILITDGDDNSSQMTLQHAGEIAEQNESIIYVLDTSTEYFASKKAKRAMEQLSEITGGQYLRADNEDRIEIAFSKIEAELRSQYAIGYKPANTRPDGAFHQISVLAPKKLVVRHRQGYFAR
jgi:VWFA-related protein